MFFGRLNPETSQNDIEKFLKKHKVPFIEVRKPDFKKYVCVSCCLWSMCIDIMLFLSLPFVSLYGPAF